MPAPSEAAVLEAARANAPKLKHDDVPKPEFTGVRTLSIPKNLSQTLRLCGSAHGHAAHSPSSWKTWSRSSTGRLSSILGIARRIPQDSPA